MRLFTLIGCNHYQKTNIRVLPVFLLVLSPYRQFHMLPANRFKSVIAVTRSKLIVTDNIKYDSLLNAEHSFVCL